MTDPRAKYEDAISAIANGKGMRNGKLMPRAACLAIRAGVCESEFVADVQGVYSDARVNEIVKAFISAQSYIEQTAANGAYVPRAKPKQSPPRYDGHVRALIGDLDGAARATGDWVRELSPRLDWVGKPPQVQTAAFLRAAFRPGEMLHVFRDDVPTAGIPGVNILSVAKWVQVAESGEPLPGDLVVANPLTGDQGETTERKPSYIAQSCLATFPFAVLEFDDMPLPLQCAFWRGFLLKSNLAPALMSLTFSGGKSIHGLLHVGASSLIDWKTKRARLVALFASDPTSVTDADGKTRRPFCVDVQALIPRQGTRLPGVRRFDSGRAQMLLYLNPQARNCIATR